MCGRTRLFFGRPCPSVAVAPLFHWREQIFLLPMRKEVMPMFHLHELFVAIVLAINLMLEYIAQNRKR